MLRVRLKGFQRFTPDFSARVGRLREELTHGTLYTFPITHGPKRLFTCLITLLISPLRICYFSEMDGLIFAPDGDPYTAGRCNRLLKWKHPRKNSIDFFFKAEDAGPMVQCSLWVGGPGGTLKIFQPPGKSAQVFTVSQVSRSLPCGSSIIYLF